MNKNTLKVLIFVIAMGTVASSLLVGVNSYTKPLIQKNEELKLKASVLEVLEIDYNNNEIVSTFDSQVKIIDKNNHVFYQGADGSLAFEFHGPGLWGPISGIISLENDIKTIRLVKVTYQEETPGLGSRIAEADYLKQFKNKEILPKLVFVAEGKSSQKNEVDAITGATGSSRALEKLLNDSVQASLTAFKE